MYDTFGKKEVNERMRELNQGKNALREHRLEGDRVLKVVQSVPMKYGIAGAVALAVTFFDTGLTCPVVRNQFAEEQELLGEEIVITLTTTNVTTELYLVELRSGQHHREAADHQLRETQEQVQPAGPGDVGEPDIQALRNSRGTTRE